MDLSNMTAPQLRQLQAQVVAQLRIKELEEKEAAKQQILAIAQSLNMSVGAILGSGAIIKPKRDPLPPKYRNPANPKDTWTGRGIPPKWAAALKEAGQLESARI